MLAAEKEHAAQQGTAMFFIRMAFWLGVAVMLLPTDAQQQARLYSTAVNAVERASTFCDRNTRTCEMGAQAWAAFLKKAEFGARLVGDMISSRVGHPETAALATPPRQKVSTATRADVQSTLLPTDLQPAWRGPSARNGI
jgi:hypothetical protein